MSNSMRNVRLVRVQWNLGPFLKQVFLVREWGGGERKFSRGTVARKNLFDDSWFCSFVDSDQQ